MKIWKRSPEYCALKSISTFYLSLMLTQIRKRETLDDIITVFSQYEQRT